MPRLPLVVVAHRGDPVLADIARTVHELFPQCVRCGEVIAAADDADVRLFRNRLVHRDACPALPPA
jgi:hypothetical protein